MSTKKKGKAVVVKLRDLQRDVGYGESLPESSQRSFSNAALEDDMAARKAPEDTLPTGNWRMGGGNSGSGFGGDQGNNYGEYQNYGGGGRNSSGRQWKYSQQSQDENRQYSSGGQRNYYGRHYDGSGDHNNGPQYRLQRNNSNMDNSVDDNAFDMLRGNREIDMIRQQDVDFSDVRQLRRDSNQHHSQGAGGGNFEGGDRFEMDHDFADVRNLPRENGRNTFDDYAADVDFADIRNLPRENDRNTPDDYAADVDFADIRNLPRENGRDTPDDYAADVDFADIRNLPRENGRQTANHSTLHDQVPSAADSIDFANVRQAARTVPSSSDTQFNDSRSFNTYKPNQNNSMQQVVGDDRPAHLRLKGRLKANRNQRPAAAAEKGGNVDFEKGGGEYLGESKSRNVETTDETDDGSCSAKNDGNSSLNADMAGTKVDDVNFVVTAAAIEAVEDSHENSEKTAESELLLPFTEKESSVQQYIHVDNTAADNVADIDTGEIQNSFDNSCSTATIDVQPTAVNQDDKKISSFSYEKEITNDDVPPQQFSPDIAIIASDDDINTQQTTFAAIETQTAQQILHGRQISSASSPVQISSPPSSIDGQLSSPPSSLDVQVSLPVSPSPLPASSANLYAKNADVVEAVSKLDVSVDDQLSSNNKAVIINLPAESSDNATSAVHTTAAKLKPSTPFVPRIMKEHSSATKAFDRQTDTATSTNRGGAFTATITDNYRSPFKGYFGTNETQKLLQKVADIRNDEVTNAAAFNEKEKKLNAQQFEAAKKQKILEAEKQRKIQEKNDLFSHDIALMRSWSDALQKYFEEQLSRETLLADFSSDVFTNKNGIVPSVVFVAQLILCCVKKAPNAEHIYSTVAVNADILQKFFQAGIPNHEVNFLRQTVLILHEMGLPRLSKSTALLEILWDALYIHHIFDQAHFSAWYEDDTDETQGRFDALFQVMKWFQWLQSLNIESGDELEEPQQPDASDDPSADSKDVDIAAQRQARRSIQRSIAFRL